MSTESFSLFHCALCGETDYQQVCEKGGVHYVQCAHCSVVRQHPYPSQEDIVEYYERYQSLKSAQSSYLGDSSFAAFKRDKELTFSDLGLPSDGFIGKRVLDVGCATGQFLQIMKAQGVERIFGVDASPECVEVAQRKGLPCEVGEYLKLNEQFDIITMWHLIEHLPRPQDYIMHAHALLPVGGWLLIETPVIGRISEAFGANWRYFIPTEHINLFPTDALIQLCSNSGFLLRGHIRFGSGNDSEKMTALNKHAMDMIAKKSGFGDTLALWMVKG